MFHSKAIMYDAIMDLVAPSTSFYVQYSSAVGMQSFSLFHPQFDEVMT